MTFGEFLSEFRQDFSGWSENTWRGSAGMLRKLEREFGDVPLKEMKPRQIEGYLTRRCREDGITESTSNRYLATLKSLFHVAKLWGYVVEAPTDGIR